MAKVKNWLFSMDAKGHLGHQLTGQGSLGGQRVQPYRKPGGKPSERQEANRAAWKEIMQLWRMNYSDIQLNWDAWNTSRRFAKKPSTSLSMFQEQMLWARPYVEYAFFLQITKLKLWNENETRFFLPIDVNPVYIWPMAMQFWDYGEEEGKKNILAMVYGKLAADVDWWEADSLFSVDLDFSWKYGIVYGKYTDGFTESEERMLYPVVDTIEPW